MSVVIIIRKFVGLLGGGAASPEPSPPRSLRLVGVTQQHLNQVQIRWSWDVPSSLGDGGTSVTYETQRKAETAQVWSATHHNGSSRSRQIAVVESATTRYQLRVRAVNNLGVSSEWVVSAPVAATTSPPPAQGRSQQWGGRGQAWGGRSQNWGA